MPTKEEIYDLVAGLSYGGFLSDMVTFEEAEKRITAFNASLIKENEELKAKISELTIDNMTHEYNEAEAQKFYPEYERQLKEPLEKEIKELKEALKQIMILNEGFDDGEFIYNKTGKIASEALKQKDPRDNQLTDDDDWIHDIEMGDR